MKSKHRFPRLRSNLIGGNRLMHSIAKLLLTNRYWCGRLEAMDKKQQPSSNWVNNLILVIQECHTETGQTFHEYLNTVFAAHPLDTSDYDLVQILKEQK